MISNISINAGGFLCCSVYQSANETTTYFNDNDGHYHSAIYLMEGNIDTYPSDTETLTANAVNAPLLEGQLYDISHTRGKYVIAKTGSKGASMTMFNPVPADKKLDVQIIKDKETLEINATTDKITIVCLTGPVNVNGKELKTAQFAVVYQNKSATLTMENNTICALVTG
jgi:hypothetical protein